MRIAVCQTPLAAEIDETQKRLVNCDGFMKGIAAIGSRKGVTIRGWYPWWMRGSGTEEQYV